MTTRYDHPDSVAVRNEAQRQTPAAAAPASDTDRLAKRFDHPDSRRGDAAAGAPQSKPRATPTERLARRYDHADSKAARDEVGAPNRQAQDARARDAKRFDHPDSQEGRGTDVQRGAAEAGPRDATGQPGAAEIRAPEGYDTNDPVFRDFAKVAQELHLDQAGAERILALHQKAEAARDAQLHQQQATWHAELEADADVMDGIESARELVRGYAGEDVRNLFNTTWIGDHPGIIRMLVKVARALKETRR